MCPGNEESAVKRRKRRITPGYRWLKRLSLAETDSRAGGLGGEPHAVITVVHSVLSMRIWAPTFFDRLEPKRLTRYCGKRLERLGHSVKLEPCVSA